MRWACCLLSLVGAAYRANLRLESSAEVVFVALTRERIDGRNWSAAARQGEDGAVVVFDGIVRNHSRGRKTLYLDYEAYEEMAAKQMNDWPARLASRFGVRHVTSFIGWAGSRWARPAC
jgi:hypothetical protein